MFFDLVRNCGNLIILINVMVFRVVIENGCVVVVEYSDMVGLFYIVWVNWEVVFLGGVINLFYLLMFLGIGDCDYL